jgi:hypothetical protein
VKVVLHPQADAEFLLAQQRYTDASPPLGRRFYDEITSVFRRIIERADSQNRFILRIIAVMHLRREPGFWKERMAK